MRKLQSVIDRVATFIAAVMCAVMMTILIVNIICLLYTSSQTDFRDQHGRRSRQLP